MINANYLYNLKEKIHVYNWYLLEIVSVILNNPEIAPWIETDLVYASLKIQDSYSFTLLVGYT